MGQWVFQLLLFCGAGSVFLMLSSSRSQPDIAARVWNLRFVGRWAPAWGVAFSAGAYVAAERSGDEKFALGVLTANAVLLAYVILRTIVPQWHFRDEH